MELDDLKSTYQASAQPEWSLERLQQMISIQKHPVLKKIRIQLILETILWSAFLGVYYDFFDGHQKPLIWNMLLIASVILILVHNVLGFEITKNPIAGETILASLQHYLRRIRTYSFVSIATRITALGIIFGFFLSGIAWTPDKWGTLVIMFAIFLVQGYLLYRIWAGRRKRISTALQGLVS